MLRFLAPSEQPVGPVYFNLPGQVSSHMSMRPQVLSGCEAAERLYPLYTPGKIVWGAVVAAGITAAISHYLFHEPTRETAEHSAFVCTLTLVAGFATRKAWQAVDCI